MRPSTHKLDHQHIQSWHHQYPPKSRRFHKHWQVQWKLQEQHNATTIFTLRKQLFLSLPYLNGIIAVNGTVLISSVVMHVNGTFNGYALQNPSTRLVGPCNGGANQACTLKAGGTCISSASETTCSHQYRSCYIDASNTCTATVIDGTHTPTAFDDM